MLRLQGLVPDGVLEAVTTTLNDAVGIGDTPAALSALIDAIGVQSDLRELFKDRRWIGTVDRFWRAEPEGANIGPLLDVVPEKPDFRTPKPIRTVHIRRHASILDRAFTLHVRLQNFDEILTDRVLAMPPGQAEISLEAPSHVTDVVLEAFNPDGTLAQRSIVVYSQGYNFGIVAQGRADVLPAVFTGAPAIPDLETRARVATVAVRGPSVGPRSGAFDTLRRNDERIDAIVGPKRWSGECVWFDRGADSQIEAIRWIKGKLENPGVRHAYLVDPFLGSEALQRVIARQGNETISLTILVSPGHTNPDAEAPDTEAAEDHLRKLVAMANAWSDRLCGKIVIIHVKRGEVARQAFHDRYLCLVNQDGVPTVYLLSNSLSKAAGNWPFVISELNRITSWRVYHYIQDLLRGADGARQLESVEVWRSAPDASSTPSVLAERLPGADADRPKWADWATNYLEKLRNSALRNSNNRAEMEAIVDAWVADWRPDADAAVIGDNVYRFIGYREQYVAHVAMRFARGSGTPRLVAERLEAKLLSEFVETLSGEGRTHGYGWQFGQGRDELACALGAAISRRDAPTNFVRDRLNPVMHSLVKEIEFRRGPHDASFNALQIATCLVSLVLEVAITADTPQNLREGMASDYVHWAGRVMRSEEAQARLMVGRGMNDPWQEDIRFLAQQIRRGKEALRERFQGAIGRIMDDPHVLSEFKLDIASDRTL
jgi:hypothetical protein